MFMAGIAQLVEPPIVIPVVAGSRPVSRPISIRVFNPFLTKFKVDKSSLRAVLRAVFGDCYKLHTKGLT